MSCHCFWAASRAAMVSREGDAEGEIDL
jgi:hypothetical protein